MVKSIYSLILVLIFSITPNLAQAQAQLPRGTLPQLEDFCGPQEDYCLDETLELPPIETAEFYGPPAPAVVTVVPPPKPRIKPTEVKYSGPTGDELIGQAYGRTLQELRDSADESYAEFDKDVDAYIQSVTQAKTRVEEANPDNNPQVKARRDEIRREMRSLNRDLRGLDAKVEKGELTQSQYDAEAAKIDSRQQELRTELRQYTSDLAGRQDAFKAASEKIEDLKGKYLNGLSEVAAAEIIKNGNGDLAAVREAFKKQVVAQQALRVTDELLDSTKDGYLQSFIWHADASVLVDQYKMSEEDIEKVRGKFNERMERTIMGGFVADKVKEALKAMCSSPDFKNKCIAGEVGALQDELNKLLGPSVKGTKASDRSAKPAEAPKGGEAAKSAAGETKAGAAQ